MKTVVITFLLLSNTFGCFSQSTDSFEDITFTAQYLNFIPADPNFEQYWNRKVGLDFRAATPYHAGSFVVGWQIQLFEPNDSKATYFDSHYFYGGYAHQVPINRRVTWSNLGHLGIDRMFFEEVTNQEEDDEQEFSIGFESGLQFKIHNKIRVLTAINYRRLFTKNRINYMNVSIGVSYSLPSPRLFKTFIQ